MEKQHIIDEIRRTAEANGGKPLGQAKFATETGIKVTDWKGKVWVRWSDALKEAGYEPNPKSVAYDEDQLLGRLACFIGEVGHYPVDAEMRIRSRNDPEFPSTAAIRRVGIKTELASKLILFCREQGNLDDVVEICRPIAAKAKPKEKATASPESTGYVYLMKSGKYYKIGFTNSLDRRKYEIGMQLPEGIEPIHSIRTDDPSGIEAYWHHRFKQKRMRGEWFNLTAKDVAIFKKRKFM